MTNPEMTDRSMADGRAVGESRRRESFALMYIREAKFSPHKAYRYILQMRWSEMRKHEMLAFIMLNPSTADEMKNDPTVERCERRARLDGYGGVIILNAYALRSTDPKALYKSDDPIGPDNDLYIAEALAFPKPAVVCAWGHHIDKVRPGRSRRLLDLIRAHDIEPMCLGVTQDGHPKHPLYISYEQFPIPYEAPA